MNFFGMTALVQILEVHSAFYPEKSGVFRPDESFILPPQNTFVSFGGNQNALCGPSPSANTLNCFSTKFVGFEKSIPIPGNLSTTPVFVDNSWVIGTTKGFLFRVKARSDNNSMPDVSPQVTEFWGPYSRDVMEDFIPKTIYKEDATTSSAASAKTEASGNPKIPDSYIWIFPSSSPFVGTPVIANGVVYALTASQSLQALDFITGKFLWSVKIASDISLVLENNTLTVLEDKIIIGTNRGQLLVLNTQTGAQMHAVTIGDVTNSHDRFPNIVAPPLVLNKRDLVVSNAASTTQRISLETFSTIWSYPSGNVNAILLLKDESSTTPASNDATPGSNDNSSKSVIFTTTTGDVVSLDAQTGTLNWKTNLDMNSPLQSATLTNENKHILVATQRGELVALNSLTGKILTHTRPVGMIIGNFFPLPQHPNESCLSVSIGGFRCFKVKF